LVFSAILYFSLLQVYFGVLLISTQLNLWFQCDCIGVFP
jgi:hypothetical protein